MTPLRSRTETRAATSTSEMPDELVLVKTVSSPTSRSRMSHPADPWTVNQSVKPKLAFSMCAVSVRPNGAAE